ncbi:Protein of unknown function [Pyronema omphalodes CBS 100304]|uniref:Uncharacterized protein n=1 Tax=Pyronema omphalodes (strain CBS 100304) TaxID=1076935 RepID=U4LQY2_PYROM|nr:Protein of unknown function [Pyronema omphalodes CBS 100304]
MNFNGTKGFCLTAPRFCFRAQSTRRSVDSAMLLI